jgi:hypothetical protein
MENLPLGRNAICNKWVFKVKANQAVHSIASRRILVAQGSCQRSGEDYSETFSHVVKLNTLRKVLAIAPKRNMHMHSADIETAFPNAYLQEEIDMRQPRGAEDGTPRVMRLLESIYGLKQASRECCKLLHQTLSSLGLKRATYDTSLYTMNHRVHGICMVLVYVDDILIVSDSLKWIESAKRAIGNQFRMTDFGDAKLILGMDIIRNRIAGTISLSHEKYTKEILEKYGMLDNTPSKVPMAPTHYQDGKAASDQDKMALTPSEHDTFRAILGSVDFVCMCTRPDIAFAISVISKRQTAQTQLHMKHHLKRVLRYLNGTRPMGITYGRPSQDNAEDIKVFSDSDWATDTTTRRSQSREVVMLNGGAVSWTSK